MIDSDYELRVLKIKRENNHIGYGIRLPLREGVNDYFAVIFLDVEEKISLFKVNGDNQRVEMKFVKKRNVWYLDKEGLPELFFPINSLEYRAFEVLSSLIN